MCVFVCVFCVVLALFLFCKISTGQGTCCTLLSQPGLCLTQHKKVDKISSPWRHLTSPFFVSAADGADKQTWSEESDCCSSVPTKSPGSSPESHRNQTELTWPQTKKNKLQTLTKRDAKRSPVTQTLLFLVKTSSCNFILESLWIPGTSILRYSIYRLNYESKLYQYVKILYVQLNCSMLLSALGCVRPPFAGWLCRRVLTVAMQAPVSSPVHAEASWLNGGDAGVRGPVLLCLV